MLRDVHPPLYYLLLRCWLAVAGESIFAVRLLSALLGILTVAAAIVLYRPLLPRPRHLAFVLLVAVSYGGVYFAQEGRSYALLLLLALIMTAAALRLALLRASPDERAWNRALGLLAAASLLAAYTHYFGVVLGVGTFGVVLATATGSRQRLARLAAAGLVVGVGLAPWLAAHLSRLGDRIDGAFWIGQGEGWYAWNLAWFAKLSFGHPLAIVLLVAGAASALRARHLDTGVRLPALVCLTGTVFLGLVDAHTPVTTGRNLIVFLPALYLLAAAVMAAVAGLLWRWTGGLGGLAYALAVAGACAEPLPWYFTAVHKAQWRESAANVLADARCQDHAIFVYDEAYYYRYFVERAGARMTLVSIPRSTDARVAADRRIGAAECPVILWAAELDRDQLDDVLRRMGIGGDTVDVAAFHDAFVVRSRSPGSGVDPSRLPSGMPSSRIPFGWISRELAAITWCSMERSLRTYRLG